MTTTRRLAAILAADVVGYSRLMGADEEGTLERLKAHRRELIDPKIAEHRGRIVKTTGDGILIEFPSVVDALRCAIEVQRGMVERNTDVPAQKRIEFRAGINLGDIIIDEDDIHGDGVNIAARLEALADPNGICISQTVLDHARGKFGFDVEDGGAQALKNITQPVHIYRVLFESGRPAAVPQTSSPSLALPDKPSIAVLPFTNMRGDAEQEYFADGLTEDLITDLSKVAGLFVIARHSSFTYKGKSMDVRRVAREMGVRYVLEGSVRKAANRVRITGQLIDATTGGHLWADRFDRELTDVFAIQDEIVGTIARSLVNRLSAEEQQLRARYRPSNLEAYELVLRAKSLFGGTREGLERSRALFERAISLDPNYAEAHAWLAYSYLDGVLHSNELIEGKVEKARGHAATALALDPKDSIAGPIIAILSLYWGRLEDAEKHFQAAILTDPNNADAWLFLSDAMSYVDRATDGLEFATRALRLNPHPPSWYYWVLGQAQYAVRNYELAVKAIENLPPEADGRRYRAAALAQLGRSAEAHEEAQNYLRHHPEFTISRWLRQRPFQHEPTRDHFVEGYRKAGLPE